MHLLPIFLKYVTSCLHGVENAKRSVFILYILYIPVQK